MLSDQNNDKDMKEGLETGLLAEYLVRDSMRRLAGDSLTIDEAIDWNSLLFESEGLVFE